jgi:hypothetical protein
MSPLCGRVPSFEERRRLPLVSANLADQGEPVHGDSKGLSDIPASNIVLALDKKAGVAAHRNTFCCEAINAGNDEASRSLVTTLCWRAESATVLEE